jgi:hypothetical protein
MGGNQATPYVLPVTCLWKVRETIDAPGVIGGKMPTHLQSSDVKLGVLPP